jgi:hypothetical protein
MVSVRGLGCVTDAAAIVAQLVDALAVAELVTLAARVAGGPDGSGGLPRGLATEACGGIRG